MKIINGLRYLWYWATQKKAKPDLFLNWLQFANAGMLNAGNIYCIEYVANHLSSEKPAIEIGSFCGLSTNVISYYLKKSKKGNKLITCDKWIFERGADAQDINLGDSDITHDEYRQFVKEIFIRNVSFFSRERPYTIEEFSADFFRLWREKKQIKDVMGREIQLGGQISFAYIDGNHSYEFVKDDFHNVDQYLEIGGFILFDDSADYYTQFGVNRLMKEIKKMDSYELVLKNPNYLFKKIK